MNNEIHEALKIILSLAKYQTNDREIGKKVFQRAIKKVENWIEEVAKEEETIEHDYYSPRDFPALDEIFEQDGKKYKVIDNSIRNISTAKLVK